MSDTEFADLLTRDTSKIIAEKYNISLDKAQTFFKKLVDQIRLFYNDMPEDIFDLWKNERLFSYPISSNDIKMGRLQELSL